MFVWIAAFILVPILGLVLWVQIKGFEYVIINQRWIFVCFGLLPISLIYNIVLYIQDWIIFRIRSAPDLHDQKVKDVSKQVHDFIKSGSTKQLCTARPGWQSLSLRVGKYKKTNHNIRVNLVDILGLDTERRVVRVEPLVSIGQLTSWLNPKGWTIGVVPELDEVTVGGLIMDAGVESSSHKYGFFQHICLSFEVVLGNGNIVTCSKEKNPDLFYALPMSRGTLGFLVSAEISVIPAKKYVRMEYIPLHSLDEIVRVFNEQTKRKDDRNEFVDGIMYSKDKAVIMVGKQTDDVEKDKLNPIGNFYQPWFYKHVEKFLTTGPSVEYIPLRHFYHRHARSIFWEMQDIIPFGNHPIFRYLFGWLVPPKISLLKLTQGETLRELYRRAHVAQDICVPLTCMKNAIEFLQEEINMYPLWLCPFVLFDQPGMIKPSTGQDQLYVDIGAYGNATTEHFHFEKTGEKIEGFIRKNKGYQMLYGDVFMSRNEFYELFDHTLYNQMRKVLDCEKMFPVIYDKISKDARQ